MKYEVKGQIYRAGVISTILQETEYWTVYRRNVKKIHAFIMWHLRFVFKITWKEKVAKMELLDGTAPDIQISKTLRWTVCACHTTVFQKEVDLDCDIKIPGTIERNLTGAQKH